MKRTALLALVAGLAMMIPSFAKAQNRQFDPAQFRQQRLDRIKEQLGASDDEWKVLSPKIEKVMDVQRNTFGGFGGGRGRGPGGGGNADNQPQTPVAKAWADRGTTVENKDAPASDIKTQLAA